MPLRLFAGCLRHAAACCFRQSLDAIICADYLAMLSAAAAAMSLRCCRLFDMPAIRLRLIFHDRALMKDYLVYAFAFIRLMLPHLPSFRHYAASV